MKISLMLFILTSISTFAQIEDKAACCAEGTLCEASQEPKSCEDILGLTKNSLGAQGSAEDLTKLLAHIQKDSKPKYFSLSGSSDYCKDCLGIDEDSKGFKVSDKALTRELKKISLQRIVDSFYNYKDENFHSKYEQQINLYLDLELTVDKPYKEKLSIALGERQNSTLFVREYKNRLVEITTPEKKQKNIEFVKTELNKDIACKGNFDDFLKEVDTLCPGQAVQLFKDLGVQTIEKDKAEELKSSLSKSSSDEYVEILLRDPSLIQDACKDTSEEGESKIYRAIGLTINPGLEENINFDNLNSNEYVAETLVSPSETGGQRILREIANLSTGFQRIFLAPRLLCNYFDPKKEYSIQEGDEISALKSEFYEFVDAKSSDAIDIDLLGKITRGIRTHQREACGDITKQRLLRLGCGFDATNEKDKKEAFQSEKADFLKAISSNKEASKSALYKLCKYREEPDRGRASESVIDALINADRSERASIELASQRTGRSVREIYAERTERLNTGIRERLNFVRSPENNKIGRSIASVENLNAGSTVTPPIDTATENNIFNAPSNTATDINSTIPLPSAFNANSSIPVANRFEAQSLAPVSNKVSDNDRFENENLDPVTGSDNNRLNAENERLRAENDSLRQAKTVGETLTNKLPELSSDINEETSRGDIRTNSRAEVTPTRTSQIQSSSPNSFGSSTKTSSVDGSQNRAQTPLVFINGVPNNLDELIQNDSSSIGLILKEGKLVITAGDNETFYPADIEKFVLDDSGAIVSIIFNNKTIAIDSLNAQSQTALKSFIEQNKNEDKFFRLPASYKASSDPKGDRLKDLLDALKETEES